MTESRDSTALPESVEDAVLAILDGDENARNAALGALLAQHPQHATAIRTWLSAAGVELPRTTAFGSGAAKPGGDDALPRRIGAYLLVSILGRGGFGTVYRAEQQEPICRPVAIKVLNPGMDSREVLGRFAAEREALNRMDHPGIARLLDAGTTPEGRPFFVMEIVEGPTLVNHCRRENLPLRARLELFLRVLEAMQHAHQKAVLHRDLSSNNVLVADPAGRAQPKIIDFGIAKSLSDPLLAGGAMTFQGTLMGTPEFMSPEQAAGRTNDIDTRCDVYALGVQLYELLCGQLPIPGVVLRAQGLAGMAHVIQSHRPRPPSEVAPAELRATLRGDLDAIVRKAIAKARDERYGSVGDFATDLQRFLADEPVQVLAPTRWYRLRKFMRRHRAESVAIAIVSLGLIAALTVTWLSLGVANRALADVSAQKEKLAAKADAGFRLLANEERLHDAIAAAAALPPPWPEHAGAFTAWIKQQGEPLANELPKVDDTLQELADRKEKAPDHRFADPADQHLTRALERLRDSLRAFVGPGGEYTRVLERQRFLEQTLAAAATQYAERWRAAIAAVMTSDGTTANTNYRGLQIKPMPGLVPLGCNPATKLYEFLDLASHGLGHALPERDATGDLQTDAETGIVLVLIPGGMLRIGARRGDPGMEQNDEHAANDELNGPFVRLDEFLLARTELTTGQWTRLSGRALAGDVDSRLPVAGIDWDEACTMLGRFDLRLPTEAQWEYACRAETTTPWSTGEDAEAVAACGWFGSSAQPVGLLRANAFGLFDLHGNVAEWCLDAKLPYTKFAPRVGDGLHTQADTPAAAPRVVRGGAAHQGPLAARSTARDARPPTTRDSTIGLRAARMLRPMH